MSRHEKALAEWEGRRMRSVVLLLGVIALEAEIELWRRLPKLWPAREEERVR
jgi:hypothetical protein